MTRVFALLLLLGAAADGADVPRGILRVDVDGVEPRPGKLIVRVYASPDHWLMPAGAIRTAVVDPTPHPSVSFDDLPAGAYAVSVVHDQNGNLTMDLSFFPFPHPIEGGGVSNDTRARFGPPAYGPSVFSFAPPDQTIAVTLHY